MTTTYKICSPRLPGGPTRAAGSAADPAAASDQVAVNERVDNIRLTPIRLLFGPAGSGPGEHRPPMRARAAVERLKLWENGRRLRVRFLDGVPEVHARIEPIAKEWESLTNLTLDFVDSGQAEIRVSFLDQGFSWSAVGTDALLELPSAPTMNYGWLEPSTPQREYERVVRHEFGHALGMIHEHQNPSAGGLIPWDKPKVYAYYAQQGWTTDDVDFNIFDTYAEETTNHTQFDPTSIMQYAVPDSLTVGSYAIGWNTDFSTLDRQFMARQYPQGSPGTVELTIDGARHAADLSVGAEVDTYHVDVDAVGTYIATTEGSSDTVLTLHGPDDPGAVLTWDDDRGQGLNARIVRKLQPGSYWLSARHKDPAATGAYTVGIKRRAS